MPLTAFNDGIVQIFRQRDRRTGFNARLNPSALDDLEFVAKLAFDESSKRQQDLEFAEQSGFQLSYKVRTRFVPFAEAKMKAVIDDTLYDIAYIDKAGREMYLYLQSVRRLEVSAGASGNQ